MNFWRKVYLYIYRRFSIWVISQDIYLGELCFFIFSCLYSCNINVEVIKKIFVFERLDFKFFEYQNSV